MINQSTTDKLIEMRLTAMADAFRIQMEDSSMKDISFEDRFGMLVDVEYTSRKNNRLKRIMFTYFVLCNYHGVTEKLTYLPFLYK